VRRIVSDAALDALFRAARSPAAWLDRPVSDTVLRAVWELVKLAPATVAPGPTARPPRVVFVRSAAARSRLVSAVPAAMREKVSRAPAVAILAAAPGCPGTPAGAREIGLYAAYLIVAARALGLDCAPVWHFDDALIEAAFLAEGGGAASFVCALGYGGDAPPATSEPPSGAAGAACVIL
jgi:3-hydroxypropanoate dehydrogenase